MNYVDGFVLAVPTVKREDYRQMAQAAAAVFRAHGALSVVECWGDDVPPGTLTSFPMAVHLQDDETVVFSWITWPSRTARDAGMQAAMVDLAPTMEQAATLFDGPRLIYGGFEVIVDA